MRKSQTHSGRSAALAPTIDLGCNAAPGAGETCERLERLDDLFEPVIDRGEFVAGNLQIGGINRRQARYFRGRQLNRLWNGLGRLEVPVGGGTSIGLTCVSSLSVWFAV